MSEPSKTGKDKRPRIPFYQDIDGFRLCGMFSAETYRSALAYKPKSGDLFIATYPKCGTTWVKNIVACIYRNGRSFSSVNEFLTETTFLEMSGARAAETMKRPGAIKVHLPYRLTPQSPEAKYIFVARNPKDCCVSFYHHTEGTSGYRFQGGEFDDYFELFLNGEVDFGDYFDNLISWYEHRNDPNVLFITYEELKKDTKKYVMKIAEFMGPQYKEMIEKDEQILRDIIRHSSFSFMKEHLNSHFADLQKVPEDVIRDNQDLSTEMKEKLLTPKDTTLSKQDLSSSNFFRKGIVGDWRNYFSFSQNARLEMKFRDRTRGTDLADLWRDVM